MKPMYVCIVCASKSLMEIAKPLAELSAEIKSASGGDFTIGMKTAATNSQQRCGNSTKKRKPHK